MSEPIYYHYRCSYPLCHAIHAEPDQATACHGEEAESVYQCGRCERPYERQGEAEECCDRHREPLPDETERSIVAAAINRGTWQYFLVDKYYRLIYSSPCQNINTEERNDT